MNALALAALAASLAAGSVPAVAAQGQPDGYEAGVAARLAGDHARAIALLQTLVAREPANADAHLQLGLALMAAGRPDQAGLSLRRVLELAPNYQDAKDALARLDRQRTAVRQAGHRWQADLDGAYSSLDRSQPDWFDAIAQLRHRLDGGATVAAIIETSRRFGVSDTYGEFRLEQRLGGGASFWGSIGGTPDADFRPEWQVAAGGSVPASAGPFATVLTAEARLAEYRSGRVAMLSPGIEQFIGGGSWLTARMINVFEGGKHHGGWLARGDWMASEDVRLFAGAADAPDTSEGVVTPVFSLFGGISAAVTNRSRLRLSVAHEDRAGSGERTQVAVGMGYRF